MLEINHPTISLQTRTFRLAAQVGKFLLCSVSVSDIRFVLIALVGHRRDQVRVRLGVKIKLGLEG